MHLTYKNGGFCSEGKLGDFFVWMHTTTSRLRKKTAVRNSTWRQTVRRVFRLNFNWKVLFNLYKAWFTIIYYLSSGQDGWLWRRCWMGWSRRELIFCNIFPLFLPVVLHQKAKPQNTRHWKIPQQLLLPRSAVRSAVKRNKHTVHVMYLILLWKV